MDSFEAVSRRLSPRQANRCASPNLVSRAVTADKPAYQLPDVVSLDHPNTYCIPVRIYLPTQSQDRYALSSTEGTRIGRHRVRLTSRHAASDIRRITCIRRIVTMVS